MILLREFTALMFSFLLCKSQKWLSFDHFVLTSSKPKLTPPPAPSLFKEGEQGGCKLKADDILSPSLCQREGYGVSFLYHSSITDFTWKNRILSVVMGIVQEQRARVSTRFTGLCGRQRFGRTSRSEHAVTRHIDERPVRQSRRENPVCIRAVNRVPAQFHTAIDDLKVNVFWAHPVLR